MMDKWWGCHWTQATSIWNDSGECYVFRVKALVIVGYSLGLVALISCSYHYCFCAQDSAFICKLSLRNILDDYPLPWDALWTGIVSKVWHTHPTTRVALHSGYNNATSIKDVQIASYITTLPTLPNFPEILGANCWLKEPHATQIHIYVIIP